MNTATYWKGFEDWLFIPISKDIGLHYSELGGEKINRLTVNGGCKSPVGSITLCIMEDKKAG